MKTKRLPMMKMAFGLTTRLAVSYVLVALIVLISAGAASYAVLAKHLWQVEEQSSVARGEAAWLLAKQIWGLNPTKSASDVAAEVRQAMPGVWAVALGPTFKPLASPPVGLKLMDQQLTAWRPTMQDVFLQRILTGKSVTALELQSSAGQAPEGTVRPADETTVQLRQPAGRVPAASEAPAVRIIPYITSPGSRVAVVAQALVEAGALALTVALLMAFWLSRKLTEPLHRLTAATGRLAAGEWETPLPAADLAEVNTLSQGLQAMAGRLKADFQQLQADREDLKQLTAETAHEIKTPVASLRTYFELLLDGEQENPDSRPELLRRGQAQVERLQYLADFLVDMARLQTHGAALDKEEMDLAAVVREEVEAWQLSAPDRGVKVLAEVPAGPVPVLANRHRIGQALANLIHNAFRWSPPGGTVTVTVEEGQATDDGTATTDGPATVRVSVADEGPGIPPEMMPKLFTPFLRGDGSTGLGLGLAIVQAVAQSHGGRVEVASVPGHGARFTLVLPRLAEGAGEETGGTTRSCP